jgi:hypothetical protein
LRSASCSGKVGKCIDYVASIREEALQRGIDDLNVEEFWRTVCASVENLTHTSKIGFKAKKEGDVSVLKHRPHCCSSLA